MSELNQNAKQYVGGILEQACMPYKQAFDPNKLSEQTLYPEQEDSRRKAKCSTFDVSHGIECLFYIDEDFRAQAEELGYTTGRAMFKNFCKVTCGTVIDKWINQTQGISLTDMMLPHFEQEMKKYYRTFAGPKAQKFMQKALPKMEMDPKKMDISTHVN